jgi:hypothetical protein
MTARSSAGVSPGAAQPDVKSFEQHLNSDDELQMCESNERSMGSLNVILSGTTCGVIW